MPIKDRNILKTYFENGDFPDESNFIDLIDSMGSLSGNNVSNGEWIINGGLTAIEIYTPQTINWDSTYTTVNSNSGSWDSDFCDDTVLLRTVSTCPSTDTIEMYANLDLNGHCLTTPCIISDANPVMFSNYTSSNYISPLDGVTDDASAITYSGTTDTLWIVQTDPGSAQTDFHEFTTDGTKLRTVIGSNFIDIEGICWISGNYFAVAEERTAAANTDELETEFDLVRFTITAGQTTVDKNGYDVSLIQLPYYRNHGPEGITYDHARDIYYINRQGIEDTNPGGCWVPGPSAIGVFSIDLNSVATPISAVELFPATSMLSSVVLASPLVSANFALTDIFYHQELENLFITTDEPDGLIQTDLAGNIIEWSPLSAYGLPQTEGVTFNTDYSNMFLVSEPNYMLTMVKGPSLVTITDGIAASRIVTAPLISATCGTSDDWCSTYTTVNSNSATWESVPPLSDVLAIGSNANNENIVGINIISATEIHTISAFTHYQDILISELSGFNVTGNISVTGDVIIDGIITANNLNIDNWDSTYTTVNTNSATWDSHADLSEVAAASGVWNSTETTVNTNSADWALKSAYNEFSDINRFYDHVAIGPQASASNEGHTLHVMGSGGVAFNNNAGGLAMYMASLTGYAAQTYYQEIDPISGHSNKWSMGMGPNGDFSIGGWHSPNLPNGNSYVYLDFDNNYVGIMESVPKTPLDVYGIASADNAVSGRHLVNYQTMDSFVTAATAGIPTDTPNLSSVLAEDNDANNQGIIGLGSLAIGATALSWGSGDITQSTGNWYEIRDPNKDRWMQANSGAGVIFYNQDAAEVLKLGATSEIPSLKVGNGIWTSEGTAISGNQIVNYDTMQTFVTAATAGIPTGGSDVSSLSGNWESTYTTVKSTSATWEAGGGSVFGNLTADNIQINSTVVFAAEYDNGVAGVAETIDWNNGNKQKSSLSENSTYTFVAPSGVGNFLLKVAQLSGSDSITWPANVLWPSGTAPTLTTTASAIDIVTFYYDNVDYYGVASLDFQ